MTTPTIFVYEYITDPEDDVVHLVKQEGMRGIQVTTLCGELFHIGWAGYGEVQGESLSGTRSTCHDCRSERGLPFEG